MVLRGPVTGEHITGNPSQSGEFIRVTAWPHTAAIHQARDAIGPCPDRVHAGAVGPQPGSAQERAAT